MHRIINAVRRHLWLPVLATIVFVILALLAPAALAYGVIEEYAPLEYSYLSPAVGTNFVKGEEPTTWVMVAAHGLGPVTVNIASSPLTGTDEHTLSDLDRVCCGPTLYESYTNEGVYTGSSIFGREAGTYYWQMEGKVFSCPPPEYQCYSVKYQTPIYSFVVTPKPAPPSPPAAPPPSPPATPPKPQPVGAPPPSVPRLLPRFEGEIEPSVGSHSGHRWRVGSKIELQLLDRRFAHTRYRVSINWSNLKNMYSRSIWRVTGAQGAWSSIPITAPQKPGHYSVTWTVMGRVVARWTFDAIR
jgi:hypothetical protein